MSTVHHTQPAKHPARAARRVGDALQATLTDNLLAVYLHGSGVLGGFSWERSDLDVLAISHRTLSDEEFAAAADAVGGLPYPRAGLEFTLVTAEQAARPTLPAPRFELHRTTDRPGRRGRVTDGRSRDGDPDLVLHLAICRQHGLNVVGPPAADVIRAIPPQAVLDAIRGEIAWAREHAAPEYLVLTAARALLYAETGRFASKQHAGNLAAQRDERPAVIHTAIARLGGSDAEIAMPEAERFLAAVERVLG
jgi:streptomycin 3"-adenylyltransferase